MNEKQTKDFLIKAPKKSLRTGVNNGLMNTRGSIFNYQAKRNQSLVTFVEENIKKRDFPLKMREFCLQNTNLNMEAEIGKGDIPEKEPFYQPRFKLTKNNIRFLVHEREKNLKERVELLAKDLRHFLLTDLEKGDKISKWNQSIFVQNDQPTENKKKALRSFFE